MPRKVPGPTPGAIRVYVPDVKLGREVCPGCDGRKDPDCPTCAGEGFVPGPDYWSNRDDPTPVTVHFRTPTEREKRVIDDLSRARAAEISADGRISKVNMASEEAWVQHAIVEHVTKVDNYTGANGKPIDNGETFAEHGEAILVLDVAGEILTAHELKEEERKNSERSSDLSCPATTPLDGTVLTVPPGVSPVNVTATEPAADSNTSRR